MKQEWFCDLCLNYGTVEVEEHASVLAILYALEDAHKAAKNVCHKNNNLHHVRMRNPELYSSEQWRQLILRGYAKKAEYEAVRTPAAQTSAQGVDGFLHPVIAKSVLRDRG